MTAQQGAAGDEQRRLNPIVLESIYGARLARLSTLVSLVEGDHDPFRDFVHSTRVAVPVGEAIPTIKSDGAEHFSQAEAGIRAAFILNVLQYVRSSGRKQSNRDLAPESPIPAECFVTWLPPSA